jgi:hypothetical protein
MYNAQEIPPTIMKWVMRNALNEMNAFLCEAGPHEQNSKGWPTDAREIAACCRAVAAAATEPSEKQEWLALADQYGDTTGPAPPYSIQPRRPSTLSPFPSGGTRGV